jgi:hypothetical protein
MEKRIKAKTKGGKEKIESQTQREDQEEVQGRESLNREKKG